MPAARGYQPGFATVQAPQRVQAPAGPSTGAGIERVGEALGRIGADMGRREDQALQDAQDAAAQRAVDEARAAEQARREAAAEHRRINGIRAANAAVELELGVAAAQDELNDQLARGLLTGDQYRSKMQEFIGTRTGELRQGLDPDAQVDFDRAAVRPTRTAELGIMRSLRDHRKREAVAELDKAGELLLREAVRDLPTALARGQALYGREGPYASTIGIDQAQKQGQAFRERAAGVHFAQRVTDSQNDPRALADLRKAIGANRDLDPTRQTALIGQIDSRTTVLENRAQAAAQRVERQQTQAFQSLQTLVDQGLPLKPEFVEQQMRTLKGSPMAATAAELVKGSAETAAFGSMSVAQMDGVLADMRASGMDPASSKLYQRRMTIRNAAESAYRADPWRAASERGVIDEVPPLDLSSIAAVGESLTARMAEAPTIDIAAGRTISPLRPEEAEGLADTIGALPVPERSRMLGAIHQAVGPERMRAIAEQMKVKDTTLGTAAAAMAQGIRTEAGVDLGQLVLRGADARKSGLVNDSDATWRQARDEVVKTLDGAYATPPAMQAAVEAVMNVYAGQIADGGRVNAEQAIRMATGGITEYNGQKIPMPYGWDARRVRKSIQAIDTAHVVAQAGSDRPLWIGNRQILPEDVARMVKHAQLRSAGPSRYAIRIGDELVTTDGRRPLAIALPEVSD